MTEPNDRELEQYLKGDSPMSRRYREASRESAPPELDEAILARARAELKRKPPSLNRILAPFALAASVLLGVNLAWNLWQVEPVPVQTSPAEGKLQSRDNAFVPAPPPAETDAMARRNAELAQQREQESLRKRQSQSLSEERAVMAERRAEAPAAPEAQSFAAEPAMGAAAAPQAKAALADAMPALSEPQKIDRLIAYIGGLQDAVFIRNGKEYGPAEAAKHLQLKREKGGDRIRTADDFIRLCAAHSSVSGDAYLIRFTDGRTRTAEDVLREELARLESR